MESELNQVGVGSMVVYTLEWMKRSNWFPWVTEHSAVVNRWVSLAAALATAVGVEIAVTGNLGSGGTVTIAYPSLQVMMETSIRAFAQFAIQEIMYQQAVKPNVR